MIYTRAVGAFLGAWSLAFTVVVGIRPAQAVGGWQKIDPVECDGKRDKVSWDYPGQSPNTVWGYGVDPYDSLGTQGDNGGQHTNRGGPEAGDIDFVICPVPDTTNLPVWAIDRVYISGYSLPAGAYSHPARYHGCIQYTNGYSFSCGYWWTLPVNDYADWSAPVPTTQWSQWWHAAYVEFDLDGSGSALRKILMKDDF